MLKNIKQTMTPCIGTSALVILLLLLMIVSCTFAATIDDSNDSPVIIVSAYSGINWQKYGQFKAILHMHTTNSDGAHKANEMLEDCYQKGFDIAAITDHDEMTRNWVSVNNGLTQQRFNEISAGAGRSGRGMLQIPYTVEHSRFDHVNSFQTDYTSSGVSIKSMKDTIKRIHDLGGISHINHPGRYTGGDAGGAPGAAASNNEDNINKYVDIFMEFPSCVGMEIINSTDGDSKSDRILWDNILARTIPQGRFVWGFSNDDAHDKSEIGYSFNVFVMPENTLENFRAAMQAGKFYAVARKSRLELGSSFTGSGPVPAIVSIETDQTAATITITANNCNKIEWISDGKVISSKTVTSDTIELETHKDKIGSYIRANISGSGGIVFTQPFGIIWR